MMKLVVVLFALVCICSANFLDRKVLSTENKYDEKVYVNRGRAEPQHPVKFGLFLFQRNLDVLDQIYEDRINPTSENYRNWMTIEEINDIIAPDEFKKDQVLVWLRLHGVETVVDNGDALIVTTTAEIAEKLFKTYFYMFEQKYTHKMIVKQLGEYSIPAIFDDAIEFVTGIKTFDNPKTLKSHLRTVLDDEDGKVVPSVINALYGIPTTWSSNSNSSVCLAEFQDDRSFAASDLATFQSENDLPSNPVAQDHIVGPYSPQFPDAESTLDVEYAAGVATTAQVWFWTVDGWMLDFANEFYGTATVPYIVSMSWGWTENDQCQITDCNGLTSQQYVSRVNTEFQKIGLRGVTLLAASGDQGAPGDGDPYCLSATQPISSIFPGASPYVTAVGATMLVAPAEQTKTKDSDAAEPPICQKYTCADPTWNEEVCSYPTALITTGGGFSNYSPRPSYQNSVVSAYLSNSSVELPPSSDFNSSNRGFPDVSAVGHNYLIAINGEFLTVDGTSCSTPVWAGMVALWNDLLLNAGKGTLGPINPLLYQMYNSGPSTYFKDIPTGNNKCSEAECCKVGYDSSTGWDPVTGLGVPQFAQITTYIQNNVL